MQNNTAEADDEIAETAADKASSEAAFLELLKSHAPAQEHPRPNVVLERYVVDLDAPLPHLGSPLTQAYNVRDERDSNADLYALILSNRYSYREKALAALQNFSHPNLVKLAGYGPAEISALGEMRLVAVFEKPKGRTLADLFAEKKTPFADRLMADRILTPIADAVSALNDLGIRHGRINPETVYLGDKVILGECVSEPCGYSQSYFFEPPERITAHPAGKGEGDNTMDAYALAVLALYLSLGGPPFTQTEKDAFIRQFFQAGAYGTFVGIRNFSEYLFDLFRGVFTEHKEERWTLPQIKAWLDGKRFNLIAPASPKDAPRPLEFAGGEYFGRKALAHAFHHEWELAKREVKDNKLSRWVELSAHKAELTELLQRIARTIGDARTDKQQSELVARTILILDPAGPLRLKTVSSAIDGMGGVVAEDFYQNRQQELNYLADLIENDLATFQSDLQKQSHSQEISQVLLKLQRVRILLRSTALGCGMERCLYDLNPNLPCQSPLILKYHALNLKDLLTVLDQIAPAQAKLSSPLDRHIAAFVTSKLELAKEVKINELAAFPALVTHPDLVTLKLLAHAQEKAGTKPMRGLSLWLGLRMLNVLQQLHNRGVREKVTKLLKKAAESGKLENILHLMADPALAQSDYSGFIRAFNRYQENVRRIELLENHERLAKTCRQAGLKLSMTIAYGALTLSAYMAFSHYMNW